MIWKTSIMSNGLDEPQDKEETTYQAGLTHVDVDADEPQFLRIGRMWEIKYYLGGKAYL
jgi:hypothetical protein